MHTWAKRGLQTAVVTGGLFVIGTGIASASENATPVTPSSPVDLTHTALGDGTSGVVGGQLANLTQGKAVPVAHALNLGTAAVPTSAINSVTQAARTALGATSPAANLDSTEIQGFSGHLFDSDLLGSLVPAARSASEPVTDTAATTVLDRIGPLGPGTGVAYPADIHNGPMASPQDLPATATPLPATPLPAAPVPTLPALAATGLADKARTLAAPVLAQVSQTVLAGGGAPEASALNLPVGSNGLLRATDLPPIPVLSEFSGLTNLSSNLPLASGLPLSTNLANNLPVAGGLANGLPVANGLASGLPVAGALGSAAGNQTQDAPALPGVPALPGLPKPNVQLPEVSTLRGVLPLSSMVPSTQSAPAGPLASTPLAGATLPANLPTTALTNGGLPTGALPTGGLPTGALANTALPTSALSHGLPTGSLANASLPTVGVPNTAAGAPSTQDAPAGLSLPNLPRVPVLPTLPELPALGTPAATSAATSALPSTQDAPLAAPAVPSLPAVHVPSVPAVPALPGLPALGAAAPATQDAPVGLTLPNLPKAPVLPVLPETSALPLSGV